MKRSIWNWLFILSGISLFLMSGALIFKEMTPEWMPIQFEYYKRLAQVTNDPARARTFPTIKQIYLPQFHKTDRCITCHTGIDNPKMADQPQPFTSHPDLGIPGFLEKHSFNEIGCTICHGGQGSATEKKAAHGPVKFWEEPLLEKGITVAHCAVCHENPHEGLKGAERLAEAKVLFDTKGCIGCHSLNGVGNQIAPELSETAKKTLDELDFRHVHGPKTVANWIYDHFKDPQRVTPEDRQLGIPETPMPNYELTDEQNKSLTALVISFAAAKEDENHPIPAKFKVRSTPKEKEKNLFASKVEQGKAAFESYGCNACHGLEGRGGVRNKNMYPGEEVPPLVYVSAGLTKDEIKTVILEGRYPARAERDGLSPPLWMPAWKGKIPDEEIDAIVEYLYTLHPEPGSKAPSPQVPQQN